MAAKILQIGDPILEKISEEVPNIKEKKIKDLINAMFDTCVELESRSAGLSACQIGKNLRICICRRTDLEIDLKEEEKIDPSILWEVIINPKIISISEKESYFWEGCLSIGVEEEDTLFGPVARPDEIRIKYLNREGKSIETIAKDFYAHIIQHEIDHLNGTLFISKVPNPEENIWKSDNLDKYIKQNSDYPSIVL